MSTPSFPFDDTMSQKIRRRKLEWHACALLGVFTYLLAFLLLRTTMAPSVENTVIIKILLLPLIVTIALKKKMHESNKAVDDEIRTHFNKTFPDYAITYELLISLGDRVDRSKTQSFRRLQLFWAGSSLYILSTMIAILANFFTTR